MKHSDETLYWAWSTVQIIRGDYVKSFLPRAGMLYIKHDLDQLGIIKRIFDAKEGDPPAWLAWLNAMNTIRADGTAIEDACALLDGVPVTLPCGARLCCGKDNWKSLWKRGRNLATTKPEWFEYCWWLDAAILDRRRMIRTEHPDAMKRMDKSIENRLRKLYKKNGVPYPTKTLP